MNQEVLLLFLEQFPIHPITDKSPPEILSFLVTIQVLKLTGLLVKADRIEAMRSPPHCRQVSSAIVRVKSGALLWRNV